jgi:hypothetical protein
MVAELFHAHRQTDRQIDRQTDTTKLVVTFHNFAKARKNELSHKMLHCELFSLPLSTLQCDLFIYLFIYDLLKDTVASPDIVSNGRVFSE